VTRAGEARYDEVTMRPFLAPLRAIVLAIVLTACPTDDPPVAVGDWGGEHVRLTVGATSAAVEYDCAHGTIDGPLVVRSDGRFEAGGTYTREHGGPIRDGEVPDVHPARYTGRVEGDRMSLTVDVLDTSGIVPGQYTLARGVTAHVFKCLTAG
jgi:hypothetical protein